MVQAASVPYRKGLELVAVSEGVSALLSQVRLTEYELPQGKAKSQFGIALEPVFVPEIDQAPVFTPAGGNFGTVDVGFLETFEVAVKVDRRKGPLRRRKQRLGVRSLNIQPVNTKKSVDKLRSGREVTEKSSMLENVSGRSS